jgi:hypothetical protein
VRVVRPDRRSWVILAIVSYPIVALVDLLNYLRFFWADLGYGIAVGILGPLAIFTAMA